MILGEQDRGRVLGVRSQQREGGVRVLGLGHLDRSLVQTPGASYEALEDDGYRRVRLGVPSTRRAGSRVTR